MEKYDVIVVGAGISGMSFAHYAAKANLQTLVLEKANKQGGSFDTYKSQKAGDFWIELGAHTCYNSYRNLIEVMEECGIVGEISPRAKVPFRALVGDQIKSFPSQINFLELLISIPKLFAKKKAGETVESYYGSIVGKKNFKKIFSALFSAVPSQNADEFPADALFKKRERRKDILKNYTMKNGLDSITNAVAQERGIEVNYDVDIRVIARSDDGYLIKTAEGDYETTNIALCVSLPAAEELMKPFAPELAEKASKIQHQVIESLGVLVEKSATDLKPFAALVPTNDDFFSAVSRDTVPNNHYRGFTFHFKPGILSKAQKVEKICDILHLRQDQIVDMKEKQNIVPSLRLGHYELIDEIDALLKYGNLYLSGNYFAGLSIEDCVSRSKAEVARMIQN
jgi:oxygen-dependent protoporphyrinogen oxidase